MISFPKRERAQRAAACVGVDAGKFAHTLVVRPTGQPDSRPLSFPTTRAGFEQAGAFIRQQVPGARTGAVLVGIEFAVAPDPDFQVWKLYGAEVWPSLYLWDRRGLLRALMPFGRPAAEIAHDVQLLLRS